MFQRNGLPARENDRSASNALPPATVRKRLFPTPLTSRNLKALRPSLSSTSAPHDNPKDLVHTPLPPIPPSSTKLSLAPSSVRRSSHARPSIASLKGTPSIRKKYVVDTPEFWLQRQVDDLTAWLNHELGDPSQSPFFFPTPAYATSDIFVASYASLLRFCNDTTFRADVQRLGKRVREANLSFSPDINVATEPSKFEQFVSLLTFSYNPTWLLLGLSVILRTNFAIQIDQILQQTENASDRVDIAALQNQLVDHILRTQLAAEKPALSSFTLKSPRAAHVAPSGIAALKQNGLVLHRALLLILLLDQANRNRDVTSNTRMPLFKPKSSAHKSQEVMDRLCKICMSDPTPLNRFLSNRGYKLQYDCPVWKRNSSFVVRDLSTDLRDGIRLCKLAGLLTGDPHVLQQVKFSFQSCASDTKRTGRHSLNVMMALDSIKSYASKRLGAKVNWNATVKDITEGDVSKTVALLWQIVELWIEAKLLNHKMLQEKLAEAQDEFRSKAADAVWCRSPGAFRELSPSIKSPSRLVIYEQADKNCIQKLLLWCAAVCGIHRIKVVDFTESFRDCVVLCLLLNHLHPHTVDMNAITRVLPAELRGEQDSLKELEIVQSNITHFENACRRLGAMPNISISAKASLAPAFISELKEESFGRVMVLMTAYVFSRAQISRRGKENLEYVSQFAEGWEDFSYAASPSTRDLDRQFLGGNFSLTPSSHNSEDNETTLTDEGGHGLEDEDVPSLVVASVDLSSPLTSHVASTEVYSPHAAVTPLSNPKTTPSGRVAGNSSVCRDPMGSEEKRKQKAAEVILSNYKAFQVRKKTMTEKESTVLLQNVARGFLARCDHGNLVRRKESFAKQLESEFWKRESAAQSEDVLKFNGEVCDVQEDRQEALNSYRLCSKSLEDVGKAMTLLPSHLKKIDEYVQAMLSHEHTLRNQQAQEIVSSGVDLSPHVNAKIGAIASPNDQQVVHGIALMETMEDAEFLDQQPETPTSNLLKRPIDTSTPGAESQVYRTPWTTFRPRPGVRHYEETPSDRFCWYTPSPKIGDSAILEEGPHEESQSVVRPQSSVVRENNSEITNALVSGASAMNDNHAETEQNASRTEDRGISKGLLSSAVAFATAQIGRAAHQYFLHSSQVAGDIVARAAYDADVAVQQNARNQVKLQEMPVSNETTQQVVNRTSPSNSSLFEAGLGHESECGDASSPDGSSGNGEFTYRDQSHEDANSSRDSGDPDDDTPCSPGLHEDGTEALSCSPYNSESGSLLQNIVQETHVEVPEKRLSEDTFRNDSVRVEGGESQMGNIEFSYWDSNTNLSVDFSPSANSSKQVDSRISSLPSPNRPSDLGPLEDDTHEGEGNIAGRDDIGEEDRFEPIDVGGDEEIGEASLETEIRTRITEALSSAEAAFENHMDRTQMRHEFDATRRREIDMRYKELDQASIASMKRLEHEEERLELSWEALEQKALTAELPFSMGFDSDEFIALLQDDSSLESGNSWAENEVELGFNDIDAMLNTRSAEDCEIDRELSELEYEREASYEALNSSVESLVRTMMTVSCVLAELRYTEYMKRIELKRERERLNSEQERQGLYELFIKSMWEYKMKLARIEGDQKELEDAAAALDERLEDTGSTVFQLLEADIDSKLMLIEHAEERESERVEANLFTRDQIWSKLMETEGLIEACEELELPDFKEELPIEGDDYELEMHGQRISNDGVKEARISLPRHAQRDTAEQVVHKAVEVVSKSYAATPDRLSTVLTVSQSQNPTSSSALAGKDKAEMEHMDANKESQDPANAAADVDNFEHLSVQLSAFKINSSRKSVDNVMSNPSSASKLRALIRRISTATASPVHRFSSSSKRMSPLRQSLVCQNIIRTVLVVMRHLHRTPAHIRLIDLGLRIVRDFCEVQNRVADLVSVENCIDVLVTCAQFYRDQENTLKSAVSILHNISADDNGLALMRKNHYILRRLEAIDHLLETAAEQDRKNRYRVQYAKMIVEQVQLSRTGQNRRHPLRDHLVVAESLSALPELRIRPSHNVLISLLADLKSKGVL